MTNRTSDIQKKATKTFQKRVENQLVETINPK